jgi:hypothetical protein
VTAGMEGDREGTVVRPILTRDGKKVSHVRTNQQLTRLVSFSIYISYRLLVALPQLFPCCSKAATSPYLHSTGVRHHTTPTRAEADEPCQAPSLAPSCSPSSRHRGACGDGGPPHCKNNDENDDNDAAVSRRHQLQAAWAPDHDDSAVRNPDRDDPMPRMQFKP